MPPTITPASPRYKLGTGPGHQQQRQHPEYTRQGGHKNWPQPQPDRLLHCSAAMHARTLCSTRLVDQQDMALFTTSPSRIMKADHGQQIHGLKNQQVLQAQ